MSAVYYILIRDRQGRWHRPRLPLYHSAAFAMERGAELLTNHYTRAQAFRVVNSETRVVEHEEENTCST